MPKGKKTNQNTDSQLVAHFLAHFEHVYKKGGGSRRGMRAERKEREQSKLMILLPCQEWPGVAGCLVPRCASLSLTNYILSLSQWMASGHPGASGPPAARSALTGAGGSVQPQLRRMGGRTARGWCCSPRTALMGSACRVSDAWCVCDCRWTFNSCRCASMT